MRKGFVAGAIVIVVALVGLWAAAWTLSPDRWRQRAEQGNADAQVKLGVAYYFGNGVTQDYTEAVKWFRLAADQGFADAQYNVGVAYAKGEGVTQDYAEAVKWYRKAADQGDADAQFNLGNAYCVSKGVPENADPRQRMLNRRLYPDEGYIRAEKERRWVAYGLGGRVPQDYVEGHKWLNLAAAAGHTEAGETRELVAKEMTPEQIAEAQRLAREWKPTKWFRLAADQGFDFAQFMLGYAYSNAQGVTRDNVEAVKWFRKAADQGYAKAQDSLGLAYYLGEGVAQDNAEGVKWYRKAADQGDAKAQFRLGFAYYLGETVPQDYAEAHKWLNLSAAAGDTEAGKNRDLLAKLMTPEQLAEAQRLAREWKPKE